MTWAPLRTDLAAEGLILMGLLHEGDTTIAIAGAGDGMWARFTQSAEFGDGGADPLDRWSKRIIGALAARLGADCAFPSDGPPYPPFIAWALRSGRFWQSPVGMLVHDTAGLLISMRGAIVFPQRLDLPAPGGVSPCDRCADRPCTRACPVGALSADRSYDVPGCKTHVAAASGTACRDSGCLARNACPVHRSAITRSAEQSAFHMRAFMANWPS